MAAKLSAEGGNCWNLLAIMGKPTQGASDLRLVGTFTRLLAQRDNNSKSETRTGRHIARARKWAHGALSLIAQFWRGIVVLNL